MTTFNALTRAEAYRRAFEDRQATLLAEMDMALYDEVMENVATSDDLKILKLELEKTIQNSLWKVGSALALLGTIYKFFG